MHEYMTRRMVALKPLQYAGFTLDSGDAFMATPIDAAYLTKCGRAAEDSMPQPVVQAPPAPAPVAEEPAPRRRGRPTNAERAARLAAQDTVVVPTDALYYGVDALDSDGAVAEHG